MEQITKEEPRTDLEKKRRRRTRKKGITLRVPAFLTRIGEDVRWYYDVRLWSPLILLLLIVAWILPIRKDVAEPAEQTAPVVVVDVPQKPEAVPEEKPVIREVEALARLADSVGAGRSDNVKTVIMWVAINRSEDLSNGYGMSLMDEIARPNQWQGYDPNMAYSEQTYKLAELVWDTIQNDGLRPVDQDMLWFVLNNNGSITVRNRFTVGANQKWNEKTVK